MVFSIIVANNLLWERKQTFDMVLFLEIDKILYKCLGNFFSQIPHKLNLLRNKTKFISYRKREHVKLMSLSVNFRHYQYPRL